MKHAWLPALALLLTGTVPAQASADMTGKEVFERHCVYCHAPGNEHPGTRQLGLTRGEDKAVLAERDDLAVEYVQYVVRHGLQSMPGFYPSDLTDAQLEALAEFLSQHRALTP
ncbi:MAG TPA: cytochrome c [Xanthomonadales bacterium]|nr:cytochrome c [Xanthomonadales bacterium]